VSCNVTVVAGDDRRDCIARIDADCWHGEQAPPELAGVLLLSRCEWKVLAGRDRLTLTLKSTNEPYRMILDAATGRFLARRL
jgi:hypothetical protein